MALPTHDELNAVKPSILRSFIIAGGKDRPFGGEGETDVGLRGEAIRQLGVMHASSELAQLYRSETNVEIGRSRAEIRCAP